jgi:hypothetical protein
VLRILFKFGWLLVAAGVVIVLASCVSLSPFMIREAPLPQGWPELTPVGEIRVQTYPVVRAAVVSAEQAGGGMEPMFYTLFEHIQERGIPMTAPVDMGFADSGAERGMSSMAFLYRSPAEGTLGAAGRVQVVDSEPATFVSIGVRGDYTAEFFAAQVQKLRAWLAAQEVWRAAGAPRYLGYNSPFIPRFVRYGEIQIPVRPAGEQSDAHATGG